MDIPLDEIGRKQASLVRDALSEVNPGRIISSPLSRARETASIIRQAFPDVCLEEDERITDIDVGLWEGMSLVEVKEKYPAEYETWETAPSAFRFPNGESLRDVGERVWPFVQSLIPELSLHDLILVSHRLTLKVLILMVLGADLNSFWRLRVDTASLSVLDFDGKNLVLSRLNDTSHLSVIGIKDARDF